MNSIASNFMRLSLKGRRFDGNAIPLNLLSNLPRLEKLVIDAAKWLYLTENRRYRQVPRSFAKGVHLQLVKIEEGNSVFLVDLARDHHKAASSFIGQSDSEYGPYYEKARDAVCNTVAAAANQEQSTGGQKLPVNLLNHFDKIGIGLRDDEVWEFYSAAFVAPVRFSKDVRRHILLQQAYAQEFSEEVTLRGIVRQINQEKMTFDFQVISGPLITAPLENQYADIITEVLDGGEDVKKIILNGTGRYDRNNNLLGLSSVDEVSILDDLDPGARIDELRAVKNGWNEGGGDAPDHKGLDWLSEAFDDHYPDNRPFPRLYPTFEGGVIAEWRINDWDLSLEINLLERSGYWHALNLSTDAEEEKDLNLSESADWQWLIEQLDGMQQKA